MITEAMIKDHDEACEEAKKRWGNGPWATEPNRVEFEYAGFQCLLSRNPIVGNWCGYVGVPKGHPAFGKHYDDVSVSVHGGLTYSEQCGGVICHKTKGPDQVYWLGFDCAHAGDMMPSMTLMREAVPELKKLAETWDPYKYETYKNAAWVEAQTRDLAEQLAAIGKK